MATAAEIVAEGGVAALLEQAPALYIRYHAGFEKLERRLQPTRKVAPTVTVLYGGTGVGKSRLAREMLTDPYVWHPQQGTWFDGYIGEPNVIFEEFRGQIPFGFLLSLLDRYCCRVQCKGSSVQFSASNIVITSPVSPAEWYPTLSENEGRLDQLMRRISKTVHVTGYQNAFDALMGAAQS